ncbi:NurA domain-containing protein [Chthonomonas calidirosea]|uniref:NurA domain n=1 Tax=Chthonomonas calidirosea (strain DSM 23976 / ICMP 18418 / T49) TaxID=1303518 RepID=S0EWE7_CHTCT|nr:DNA double-strand break repair nuclease NurA [Chthonomonas calidirosea]CCW35739.1 NurA domain [Chthonomonas calidirosea T49]CEK19382.1 NurA domain-containing protein [Chthonomonas calidirosea]
MLDFRQVAAQLQNFTLEVSELRPKRLTALEEALRRMESAAAEWQRLDQRLQSSRTSWLLPTLLDVPHKSFALSTTPSVYTAVAVDGSQILPERHDILPCYLLNIGSAIIRYRPNPHVELRSCPSLSLFEGNEEMQTDELEAFLGAEQGAILPRRFAVYRFLNEIEQLATLAEQETEPPFLMADGSLILWPIESEAPHFRENALHRFMEALERMQARRAPIVGYISAPQSREVVNMLRVARCPHPKTDCDRFCPKRLRTAPQYEEPACAGVEVLTDADLFAARLRPGERSALFGSRSKVLQFYGKQQRIYFFYLHTGAEIARIELPAWVAEEEALLERVHALCYDQARKGSGYPVALAEAHEQAIVRAPEREVFFRLLEAQLVAKHVPVESSRKAMSKRMRRI